MPYCYAPRTNLDVSPTGDINPCCKFRAEHYSEKFNISTNTLDDYKNSKMLAEVKQDFNNNLWPKGCERCRIEEENNIPSKRQLDWDRWKDNYTNYADEDGFITSSVAFGNVCNLKCITCGPESSSRWYHEYKDIYGIETKPLRYFNETLPSKLAEMLPNLIHMDIPGGEPFLSGIKEQQELLTYYCETGKSSNITLHYTTNGIVFPDDVWWSLWKNFKEIDLQISIDGINRRYEYIRYPAEWSTLCENTQQYLIKEQLLDNIRLSVSHTVSAYNIFYLDEFFTWCKQVGLPTPWLGRVHTPVFMRPTVWNTKATQLICKHLAASEYGEVKEWATLLKRVNDDKHFDMFCTKLKQHDNYRGLSFANIFEEMGCYINGF